MGGTKVKRLEGVEKVQVRSIREIMTSPVWNGANICYDEDTGVMYLIIRTSTGSGDGVAITPLFKADGSLKIYKPDGK